MLRPSVFIAGSTGYVGSRLAADLVARGHDVHALARKGSESNLPRGCEVVFGDALHSQTYATQIAPATTFIHLVGVSHPSPSKAAQFRSIDLASCAQAVEAAKAAGIQHFIYLSVARPAPVMKEYQAARAQGEELVRQSGMSATFVRPWYVLGPGHRWPTVLQPMYAVAKLFASTRDGAERLALVTIEQMVRTLAWAVENPATGIRILEPRDIRTGGLVPPQHRKGATAAA